MPSSGEVRVQARVHYRETLNAMKSVDRRVDRASMWGLRAAGRAVKQRARRQAPVGDATGSGTNSIDPHPGQLKQSIHSSRRLLHQGPRAYGLTVGPRGAEVMPYRKQREAETGYMRAGLREAEVKMVENFRNAYRRAMSRA